MNEKHFACGACDCSDCPVLDCEFVNNAVEKQIEKKIEEWNGQASCPCCEKLFGDISIIKNLFSWEMPYCKWCGQKLDWSEVKE